MGRPKGSKNKPKVPVVAATPEAAPVVQKKRGSAVPAAPTPTPEQPKRKGRPKGSKNKPKTDAVAPVTPPAPTPAPTPAAAPAAAPKGKRAAKTIVPTVTPEALTTPASPSATPPVEVVRTPTDSDAEPVETLTAAQLNHPALAGLLATATTLLANASPSRKLMFENKANTDYTAELATLRTLVEFFEIDVAELIAKHAKKV